jgi:hypothetical protein
MKFLKYCNNKLLALKRWLYITPIAMCITTTLVFADIFRLHEEYLFNSRITDCKLFTEFTTQLIDNSINRDNDWYLIPDFYRDWVIWSANMADERPNVLGLALDRNLNILSTRSYDPTNEHLQYDPTKDPLFVATVTNNDNGVITLNYTANNRIVLYYKWIPSPSDQVIEPEYLFVVGMLTNVDDGYSHRLIPTILVLILMTLVVNYLMLYCINTSLLNKQECERRMSCIDARTHKLPKSTL